MSKATAKAAPKKKKKGTRLKPKPVTAEVRAKKRLAQAKRAPKTEANEKRIKQLEELKWPACCQNEPCPIALGEVDANEA